MLAGVVNDVGGEMAIFKTGNEIVSGGFLTFVLLSFWQRARLANRTCTSAAWSTTPTTSWAAGSTRTGENLDGLSDRDLG